MTGKCNMIYFFLFVCDQFTKESKKILKFVFKKKKRNTSYLHILLVLKLQVK